MGVFLTLCCQKLKVSGVSVQDLAIRLPDIPGPDLTSYETTRKYKSEPQNIECRMLNVEGWKRFAKSFKNRQNTFIRCWTFDAHQFLFRLNWTLASSGAACMNLADRTIKGSLAANSENPSYRTRAGRNLTPDTDTLRY